MICSLFFFWAVISYLTFIQSDCKHFLERPWGNWNPKLNLIWRPEAKSGNYWHLHLLLQKSTLPFLFPNFMLMFHQRERESLMRQRHWALSEMHFTWRDTDNDCAAVGMNAHIGISSLREHSLQSRPETLPHQGTYCREREDERTGPESQKL